MSNIREDDDMTKVLDDRFSNAQSLQDLVKEATKPISVTLSLEDIQELYRSIYAIKDAIESSSLEEDTENERNLIRAQLEDINNLISSKINKSETLA